MTKALSVALLMILVLSLNTGSTPLGFAQEPRLENVIGRGQLAAVIGEDDRRALTAAEANRYRAIGVLETEDIKPPLKGVSKGTGFLVSPEIVVTATHVIANPSIRDFGEANWSFSIFDARGELLEKKRVSSIAEPISHEACGDVSAVVLEEGFKTDIEFLKLPQSDAQSNYVGDIKLIGFHADKAGLTIQNCGIGQEAALGLMGLAPGQFMHSCDTANMSSGSPLIAEIAGEEVIVGINLGCRDNPAFKQWSKFTTGVGVRITTDFLSRGNLPRPRAMD